jgi:hypothetical protein
MRTGDLTRADDHAREHVSTLICMPRRDDTGQAYNQIARKPCTLREWYIPISIEVHSYNMVATSWCICVLWSLHGAPDMEITDVLTLYYFYTRDKGGTQPLTTSRWRWRNGAHAPAFMRGCHPKGSSWRLTLKHRADLHPTSRPPLDSCNNGVILRA